MTDKAEPQANERGEIMLALGGHSYHLRPSYQAIAAIEEQLGRSLQQLTQQGAESALTVADMGVIASEMMKAYARSHPDDPHVTDHRGASAQRLSELVFEAGAALVAPKLTIALIAALMGGVDAQGELKATAESPQPAVA